MPKEKLNRLERDRYLSHISSVSSDIEIWGQYDRLVDFVFDQFPKTGYRFDLIAHPLLFMISHGIELGIKENIKLLREHLDSQHLTKFQTWAELIKSHDLINLAREFKITYYRLFDQFNDSVLKKDFDVYFKHMEELISILQRGSETFRYAIKMDNDGKTVKKAIEDSKIIDLLVVEELFKKVNILLIGAPNEIAVYTDYLEYLKGNPDYKRGIGYLLHQKIWYDEVTLNQVTESLDQSLQRIGENHWLDLDSGENYELRIWNGDIYVIAIDPSKI